MSIFLTQNADVLFLWQIQIANNYLIIDIHSFLLHSICSSRQSKNYKMKSLLFAALATTLAIYAFAAPGKSIFKIFFSISQNNVIIDTFVASKPTKYLWFTYKSFLLCLITLYNEITQPFPILSKDKHQNVFQRFFNKWPVRDIKKRNHEFANFKCCIKAREPFKTPFLMVCYFLFVSLKTF